MRFFGGVVRKKNQNALFLFDPYLSKKIMKNRLTKLKRKLDIIQTATNFKGYFKEILTYYQSRLAIMDARSVLELKIAITKFHVESATDVTKYIFYPFYSFRNVSSVRQEF